MASLQDNVKQFQEELQDGIAWVAFWREGRSWNSEYFYLEIDDTLDPLDRSRLKEIQSKDPAAVILNGYDSGHLGADMSLDELTAGVRWHYENGTNQLAPFIEAHDDTLPPELIEEARAIAHAAGLPFSEKPYKDDFDPYVFDGSMSIEDYELMHRMIEKERSDPMAELKAGYSSYDYDKLDAADKMKIERSIYFDKQNADIAALTALPLERLQTLREESAAAEQSVFDSLKSQAAAWEKQAGKTLLLDKAIEYARVPEAKHTANKWQDEGNDRHTISNRVYQMSYHFYENTRYDKAAQKSIPYSYTLTWNIYTNSPDRYGQAKIAGQDRKVFADKAAMEKYLNGRIKAYQHLFTEISPPIPTEYAEQFKVNGQLLPGYTIEGEEIQKPQPAADIPASPPPRNEPENETEQFAILIDSRSRFETGEPGGCWLSMPATKEQLHEAMASVGITADNPQDFFIHGYSDREDRHIALPYDMVCAASVDELNFLASRLETLEADDIPMLNAAAQSKQGFENIGQMIDFTYNTEFFVHIPEVHTVKQLGDYYLNKSGMVLMPDEWKSGIDPIAFGKNVAAQEKGSFTEYGYLVQSGDEWEKHFEGREVPEEYRIMSYPQPTRPAPDKVELDAAPAAQAAVAAEPQEPRPVIPIVLTSEKPAEKMKEITDRLEQGISELFESERYKEYLRVMSRFHNYSFNNTLLIAMQKPDASLVAGFTAWKNNFHRNVVKGQKGIKILAPSPFKIKKEMEKIDPQTQKPLMGKDGKPVTEEKEITIPAFKVVSVFDVSQTEGKELPDIVVNELTGDVEHFKDVFSALEKTSPVPIGFEKIEGGAHGYYHLEEKRIAIDEGMSQLQTLKTAIHEIAHAKLHDIDLNAPLEDLADRPDRRTREVQAESVAYAVCQHYGLDTSDYSFGYVAGWSSGRELAELKTSLETIRNTAAEIINSIDEHIAELQKDKVQEQTTEQEAAYRLEDGGYLYIQTCESGYDYTLYDRDFSELDGGQLDNPDLSVPAARDEILALHELSREHIEALPVTKFEQAQEAAAQQSQSEHPAYDDSLDVKRADEAATLAFAIDSFFRETYPNYAETYPAIEEQADVITDYLIDGSTVELKRQLVELADASSHASELAEKIASYEKDYVGDTFLIYQLKRGEELRDLRFEAYDRLQAAGHIVDPANYELIYTAPLDAGTSLNDIYIRFNIDHPADFEGHSLSMSDVVVIQQNGQDTAHYVDSGGNFPKVPEFLRPQTKELIPDEYLTGEQIRTPRGSFSLTSMSVEQMKEAGYGLHHTSEDGKFHIMGNGTRAFAVAAEQPEKANPLKHIEDTVEQNDNNFDGVINNTPQTPTVDELEQKAKAGEPISLVDLADAIKADKERGKEKPAEKPSIRAQLKADKKRAAQKKPAKTKNHDLEV